MAPIDPDPESVATDSASPLVKRVHSISKILEEEADASDAMGMLTAKTIAALRSGRDDFFRIMAPACVGGFEMRSTEALRVIEDLSYANGSVGWVVMAAGLCIGTAAAFLEDGAVSDIFSGASMPIIAGHGGPNGTAVVERGGFRLSGHWRYGSGTRHADYIHSGAIVIENGTPRLTPSGEPEVRIFVTPRRDAVLADNWNVLGLRATGSVDYTISDLFVPEGFTHPPGLLGPKRGGDFYRIGLLGIAIIGHTAFALGVGRRALDEIAAFAREQSGPTGRLRESDAFHEHYGSAEAHFRSARALVYETWQNIERATARGDVMSVRQITLARLAMSHVTSMVADICSYAYKTAGGPALRDGTLQRCFRDIHAGTQHLHAHPLILRECGRELAGMAHGQAWGRFGLT